MSRAYDMHLQVAGFRTGRLDAIKAAAEQLWTFDWFHEAAALLEGFGESSLCGGQTEEQFAVELARAVWQANGGFCELTVTATYLEDLPHEDYSFDEDDFARLQVQTPRDNP